MRIRFNTDRALYETFPTARDHVKADPIDADPLQVMRGLAARGKSSEALSFCAYLLPRREAVGWACRSANLLSGDIKRFDSKSFQAAEAWVREPDDLRRQIVSRIDAEGNNDDPATWLARAAAWAGGGLSVKGSKPIPAPPHLTAVAIRVSLLLILRWLRPGDQMSRVEACVADAARIAETGL